MSYGRKGNGTVGTGEARIRFRTGPGRDRMGAVWTGKDGLERARDRFKARQAKARREEDWLCQERLGSAGKY